jgi:hypothetical protein
MLQITIMCGNPTQLMIDIHCKWCAFNFTICNAVILTYSVTNIGLVRVVCLLVVEHVQCYADSCDKRLVGVGEGDVRVYMNLFITHELNVISLYLHGC